MNVLHTQTQNSPKKDETDLGEKSPVSITSACNT